VAARANWKGFLKVGELTCPVALYTAASTSERIAFHTLNRETGNRVRRVYLDAETGKPVESEDQVKGYEIGQDEYVVLEPEEIAAAVPDSDKTLSVEAFIPCGEVDQIYLDRPYYLAPSDAHGEEAFALIREGMRAKKVVGLARTVLFRRVRTLLIDPRGKGMVATTLNFDYEVRSASEAFADVPELSIKGEMLDLAQHIIGTKRGKFDPAEFRDRYEAALADLVKAKIEGRPIERPKVEPRSNVIDLMEALRQSAKGADAAPSKSAKRAAPKKAVKKAAAKKATAKKGARKAEPQRRKAS
jgi:DNA end-binding protein Ku